jgi:GTP-binding protein
MTSSPVVAIVGRPNVGKSTLFNRLVGHRQAVVAPAAGTTRDRVYGSAAWRGMRFSVVDTGGIELSARDGLPAAVQRHVQRAVREADALVWVCDGTQGLLPADQMILDRLRPAGKPTLLAVNKLDHRAAVPPDFFAVGMDHVLPISALHGRGIGDLLDEVIRAIGRRAPAPASEAPALAIVGRQNVGKSSFLNALLRDERAIVSDQPGTTRDALDTPLTINGQQVTLIDTAGLRHRRKVRDPVDLFSMSRTLDAVGRATVALVLLDGTQGVTRDDHRIVNRVCDMGRGMVLVVNKWDAVKGGRGRLGELPERVYRKLPYAAFAPVVATSAKTGFQVPLALATALRVARTAQRGLGPEECVAIVRQAWEAKGPPRFRGRLLRLRDVRWLSGTPPRLELATEPVGQLPKPYLNYLLKKLYRRPELSGIPVQIMVTGPRPKR